MLTRHYLCHLSFLYVRYAKGLRTFIEGYRRVINRFGWEYLPTDHH